MHLPRLLFVTGKLAEPALRRMLGELAPRAGFEAEVAVLPITVVALATIPWIARHLTVPDGVERVVLPGLCQGDLAALGETFPGVGVERGPADLADLPDYFQAPRARTEYGAWDVSILAEINHVSRLSLDEVLAQARSLRADGADIIDLGCDPGGPWPGVGDTVRALSQEGLRVSIDTFDPHEVEAAVSAGAELVLSVNGNNLQAARSWGCEVVVVPDQPSSLEGLDRSIETLLAWNVPFRIDPILEPIGLGFAASLARYLEARRRYPGVEMLMGVGNVTELTDVDSAGANVVLMAFCQEVGIRSVLTTQVINWCQSAVRELDRARRLTYHACTQRTLPKHLDPDLVLLRDARLRVRGAQALAELAARLTDRNFRLFAERGKLHVLSGRTHLEGDDPFALFDQMRQREDIDPAHAFYLGYEMAKAVTALTLGKNYVQDQALRWGFLTVPEESHRAVKSEHTALPGKEAAP